MPTARLQPHGYPNDPTANKFYSLTDAARLTTQRDPWLSLPVARWGERLGRWSGTWIPELGERVRIKFPEFGGGVVVAYFVERDCLGVEIARDQRSHDGDSQGHAGERNALIFGSELTPVGLPSGEVGPFARPTFPDLQRAPAKRATATPGIMTDAEANALAGYLARRHPHRKSGWDVTPNDV